VRSGNSTATTSIAGDDESLRQYSDTDLLTAYRLVYDRQPYQRMSQSCYESYRPAEFPGATTIQRRFGGWPAARKRAWECDDGE